MFPLKQRKIGGYQFGQHTFYNSFHTGTDYQAYYETYTLPFTGTMRTGYEYSGGNWLELKRENGDILTARHLSKFLVKAGVYPAGTPVAVTGNTGLFTTKAHLHQEVKINGKLTDPEKYDWTSSPVYNIPLRIKLVMNQPDWKSLTKHAFNLISWFYESSGRHILPVVDWVYTDLKNWETEFTGPVIGGMNVERIKESWFDANVLPHAPGFDVVLFVMTRNDWHGTVFDHPELMELGYAYESLNETIPLKAMLIADENDDFPPYYPAPLSAFAKLAAHETCHLLSGACLNDTVPPGSDFVHNYFYGQNGFPMNPGLVLSTYDYEKLANFLNH